MVELRKRKAAPEATSSPPAKKNSNPIKKAIDSVKEAVSGGSDGPATNGSAKIAVGHQIDLEGFGGEVETHTGERVTLAKLLEQSKSGVVLFTYPKASTPGCTTQACLFRDNHSSISAPGLSLYGLSTDSPKSNTNFATKQSLPFPLLCDPHANLIGAIGMKKAPKSTSRGVVIIDKSGIVKVWEQAGPQKTVDAVMAYVQSGSSAHPASANSARAPANTKMTEAPAGVAIEEAKAAPTTTGASTSATAAPPAHPSASSMDTHPDTTEQPPKMDEVPLIKEPSAEEAKAAETAAEVSETAAQIDSAEKMKP